MPARLKAQRHSATARALGATEAKIQKAFVQSFDLLATPEVFLFSVPNERHSSPQNMAHLKAMGLRPGCPDVWVIWRGGGCALEFKSLRGTVSDAQKAVHARLREIGWSVVVVRSVDEAWDALHLAGAPVRQLIRGVS